MTKPLAAVVLAALLLAPTTTQAWVGPAHSAVGSVSTRQNNNKPCRRSVSRFLAVELEPEPEGGTALNPFTSLSGCRMKQLDETVKTTNSENNDPAYKFWMTAQAEGELIKEIRTQILKDASKKANFPGFRKGQVPPYAQPQITQFAVQESIIKTVEAAMEAYGLLSLKGSDGEVKVHEDVSALAKGYKTGESIQFTATVNASYDPEKARLQSTESEIAGAASGVTATTEEVGAEK